MPNVIKSNEDSTVAISRIEPPNWWVGMRRREVTLTISGHNVGKTRPALDGLPGVSITGVELTDSVNYMFVRLRIDEDAVASDGSVALVQGGQEVARKSFSMKARKRRLGGGGLTPSDAVYLVMPDRFARGETAPGAPDKSEGMREKENRRAPYGRHGGDIRGIHAHLDYIYRLGMTALWATPVQTNDMETASYHGYAITDYYAIDPRLGTLQDYILLTNALHQRGLKIVMDFVMNHCGTSHEWLSDAPSTEWFNTFDALSHGEKVRDTKGEVQRTYHLTNYRPGVMCDSHASRYDKEHTIRGWFDKTMADLNLSDKHVIEYFTECAKWWVETADLDAIRMDTVPYMDAEGFRTFLSEIAEEYPSLTILGETWIPYPGMLSSLPNIGAMMHMDFPLQEAVSRAFAEGDGWGVGANRLYDVIASDSVYADASASRALIFGDNHDTGRLLTRLGGDREALRLALIYLATTRGVPQIYYGTEILMEGDSLKGDATIRQDMPEEAFELMDDETSQKQTEAQAMYRFTSELFGLRKRSEALQRGKLTHFVPQGNMYVYFRKTEHQTLMVILNLSHKRQTIYAERYAEFTGYRITGVDLLTGRQYKDTERISVKGRSALIIEI